MNTSRHSFPWKTTCWTVLIAVVIWCVAQQLLFKPVIEAVATQIVGARVSIGSFSVNLLTHRLRIADLKIYNEAGFRHGIFFDAPEILVDVDWPQLLQGKMHFPLVIFNLDKIMIFKNQQGKLNVNELKIVQEKLHEKHKGPAPNFKIDELQLNIEQVIVQEDDQNPPLVEAYDLNLKHKTIRNIDGVPKLVGSILFEALKPTAIQSAGLYAATTLLGVGFLPGLAIGVAIANDKAALDFPRSFGEVYRKTLQLVRRLGTVQKADDSTGVIVAKVYGCNISIEVENQGWDHSKITIKARKYFLAKPEIAAGLLYQLKQEL